MTQTTGPSMVSFFLRGTNLKSERASASTPRREEMESETAFSDCGSERESEDTGVRIETGFIGQRTSSPSFDQAFFCPCFLKFSMFESSFCRK